MESGQRLAGKWLERGELATRNVGLADGKCGHDSGGQGFKKLGQEERMLSRGSASLERPHRHLKTRMAAPVVEFGEKRRVADDKCGNANASD